MTDQNERWCCSGNAEDCPLCDTGSLPYPWICPGHPDTPENRQKAKPPTPADELRQAADKLSPDTDTAPTLTDEYPDLDACQAYLLRSTADAYDLANRGRTEAVDATASWIAPALAAARQINGTTP
ncbi:hypothetical protein ACGFNY_44030 [Streptomyces chartreusis]|uniref:hypothetical protein n=1 Tax=Streptomyces chartreusis TaxID=1969 RepID=UPI0037151545